MTYPKVDINQPEIVKQLRDLGYSVLLLNKVKQGCPDILVGKNGKNILVEIKQSGKDKLTEDEKTFFSNWNGQVMVAIDANSIIEEFNKSPVLLEL